MTTRALVVLAVLPAIFAAGRASFEAQGAGVPEPLAPYHARAQAAFDALQKTIGGRLREVMAGEGAAAAVGACKTDGPALTAEVAKAQAIALGRTSHRLRNPANAAPAWARARVESGAGLQAADAAPFAVDLGDRVGVMAPIAAAPMCLSCHGDPAALDQTVRAALAARYPDDRATGFAAGDLRGWFWAELRK